MMTWIVQAALGGLFALGAWLAWDLARANLRHGHHEATRLAPVVVGDGDPRFGSMSLTSEQVVHHELPVTPREPDWLDELGPDWIDRAVAGIHDRYWPAPTEAEVAASRALHGYIPELDPGPEAAAPAPSPDQDTGAGSPRWAQRDRPAPDQAPPQAGQDRPVDRAPSTEAPAWGDLGPRAGAVLAAYEQRLGARREACT